MSNIVCNDCEDSAERIVVLEEKVYELILRVEALEPSKYGECDECGRELDEDGYCSYPCPNCD